MQPPGSKMQLEFWANATHRWNVKTGATRSGKTYMDYYVIPRRLLAVRGKEGLAVILGNTRETIRRNIIYPMQAIYGTSRVSNIRSDNSASLFGERVFCLGADNIAHVDKLRGASIKYCYGDEVTTWNADVFEMLKSRLDKPYSCFDGTCNPDSPYHWFKRFLDSDADIYQQAYTIDDNPYLDPVFVANLKKEYAGTVYYQRYILGRWALAEGVIYPAFSPEAHVSDKAPNIRLHWVGVDYGHTNPTVFLHLGSGEDGNIWVLDEYYHPGQDGQISPKRLSAKLTEFERGYMVDREVIDPSAEGFINQRREDDNVSVRKADNRVIPGIHLVSGVIGAGLLRVHPRCKHTIEEFQSYVWDEKAQLRGEDKPLKTNDHCMDALRYGLMAYEREIQRRLTNARHETDVAPNRLAVGQALNK